MSLMSEIEKARKATIERCVVNLNQEKVKVGDFILNKNSKVIVDWEIRDRVVWSGDLFTSGPAAAKYLKDGLLYWRNSLLLTTSKIYKSGKLPACVSLKGKYRFLSYFFDTYGMWWIISADGYLKRTKDKKFRKFFRQILSSVIGFYLKNVGKKLIYKTGRINFYSNWTVFRPRENVLTNVLLFKCLQIYEDHGFRSPFSLSDYKKAINQRFWNRKESLYFDNEQRGLAFLDGNSLCLMFSLATKKRKVKLIDSLKKFDTPFGPKAYIGNPRSITSYHKNIVSPFIAYVYALALTRVGHQKKARIIVQKTILSGLNLSKKFGQVTIPEFWKINGELGARAVTSNRFKYGRSLCHAWSTFGDYIIFPSTS